MLEDGGAVMGLGIAGEPILFWHLGKKNEHLVELLGSADWANTDWKHTQWKGTNSIHLPASLSAYSYLRSTLTLLLLQLLALAHASLIHLHACPYSDLHWAHPLV